MSKKAPVVPPDRGLTPRAILHEALLGAARTTLELSARASIREKEVLEHLEHLVQAHQSGARAYSAPLWTLLMFEAFLRNAGDTVVQRPLVASQPLGVTA